MFSGADILFYGNIPNGAGLSSSASIELATGVFLKGLFDLQTRHDSMIQLGQKVENRVHWCQQRHYGSICDWYGEKGSCHSAKLPNIRLQICTNSC